MEILSFHVQVERDFDIWNMYFPYLFLKKAFGVLEKSSTEFAGTFFLVFYSAVSSRARAISVQA